MQAFDLEEPDELLAGAGRKSAAGEGWSGGGGGQAQPSGVTRRRLLLLGAVGILSLLLSIAALGTSSVAASRSRSAGGGASTTQPPGWAGPFRRVAFGSCSSYDIRPQPIWTEGVIPAQPDAWVWLGDLAYMDDPLINCNVVPDHPQCNCTADFMRRPPFQCFAGVVEHARLRVQMQLGIREYQQFLAWACPGYQQTGVFPPQGSNPAMCTRAAVLGAYDDHDSGVNNGNTRNPAKDVFKNIFLDAIGELRDSPRRSSTNGLQVSYTLPGPGSSSGDSGKSASGAAGSGRALRDEINLVLLDERFFRETLPCSAREQWCRRVLNPGAAPLPAAGDVAWCRDFLVGDGSPGGRGSCCRKRDEWRAWCSQPANTHHPDWPELCDPTRADFAARPLVLAADNKTVLPLTDDLWDNQQAQLWPRLIEAASSPMCEVLGPQQRAWLQQQLRNSTAALNIVASGSVLAGSLGYVAPDNTTCSGDDLACYPEAQVNLLHTLANTSGCVVLLVGDYHYSDLKVIRPGAQHGYSAALRTASLRQPVYQAMSSGLSYSTAEPTARPCVGSFREDLVGLRPGGPCSFVPQPAFGVLEVDWGSRIVSLTIRNGSAGANVARGYDGSEQAVRFSLDTCQPVGA